MRSIRIAEGDDAIRNNIVRLLKLAGFHTIWAPDGHSGPEHAKTFKPDVIGLRCQHAGHERL